MKSKKWYLPMLSGLLSALLCLPLLAEPSAPPTPPLFEHIKVEVPATAPALTFAVAYQPVRIRWQVVLTLQEGSRLKFNLMDGVNPIGIVERVERRAERFYSAFGHLEGHDGTHFILVVEEDVLALYVSVPAYQLAYDLRPFRDDLYVVVQVGEELPCGTSENLTPPPSEMTPEDADWHERFAGQDFGVAGGDFGPAACVQPQAVLDVAVYYTAQARQAIGGATQMNARIQLFIDQCNLAYSNSNTSLRARLVRRLEVNYPGEGGGDGNTQLNELTRPSDGVLDAIHTDRNNYRVDQVVLLVNAMNYCGLAWCGNGADPERAFNVTQYNCTNYTFAHEIGHNQGCGHDRANGGCGFRSYGFGWRFTGNDEVQYRTVMAYSPGLRIPHFSNPNVLYQGQPTGRPIGQPDEAHNAMVIFETRRGRENFRLLDIWVDFGYTGIESGTFTRPFNTVAEGANAITTFVDTVLVDFPTLYIKAGARHETVTINKRMRLQACGGTVRIGAP